LKRNLRRAPIEYLTADLLAPADRQLDITAIDLPDASFDVVICSHVLEHVPDDRRAMSEMLRVLRPGGRALVMVPYDLERPTHEDPSVSSPEERLRRFGQHDHVRRYGADLGERLSGEGFEVSEATFAELFDRERSLRHALPAGRTIFDCRRPETAR
jgi:SAM-dependent methyltransferase